MRSPPGDLPHHVSRLGRLQGQGCVCVCVCVCVCEMCVCVCVCVFVCCIVCLFLFFFLFFWDCVLKSWLCFVCLSWLANVSLFLSLVVDCRPEIPNFQPRTPTSTLTPTLFFPPPHMVTPSSYSCVLGQCVGDITYKPSKQTMSNWAACLIAVGTATACCLCGLAVGTCLDNVCSGRILGKRGGGGLMTSVC